VIIDGHAAKRAPIEIVSTRSPGDLRQDRSEERANDGRPPDHGLVSMFNSDQWLLVSSNHRRYVVEMGEHVTEQNTNRRLISRKQPKKQTAEAIGRKLLDVVVYRKHCRIGNKLTLDDLAETSEVGD
jgi:hypothetical protein